MALSPDLFGGPGLVVAVCRMIAIDDVAVLAMGPVACGSACLPLAFHACCNVVPGAPCLEQGSASPCGMARPLCCQRVR